MRKDDASTLANEKLYRKALTDGLSAQLDYYSEFVELARFAEGDYQSALRDFLKNKYRRSAFDLIIATGDIRNFLARYGAELFPNTPVVFSMSDDAFDNTPTPSNFTGLIYETDRRGTLDIILALQPAVRRVFVVTGASQAVDQWHEARARRQFKDYEDRLEFIYLSGLPMDELKRRISNLTPDSVVYFIMFAEDGAGSQFTSAEALDQIAASSSVPVYTWHDGFLGHGVVGGQLASSERVASRTTELALRILRGERVDTIPITKANTSRLAFDWRELQRWNLDEARLPAGAEVLFKEPTFWQRYRYRILGVLSILMLQSALIAALLVEQRRRRKATIGLKESEARYRNVVQTQTELICRFLPDTTLTFVNDAYCKYFEKSADELVGTKFIVLVPEQDHYSTLTYFESLATNRRNEIREHPVLRPNGTVGWHQWANCIISSGSGQVELQGVGRDISERKELEQQLIRSERLFSTLVENSPDVISRLDLNLRYIHVGSNLERLSGVPIESFIGKTPHEVAVPGYDWNAFESKCRETIDKKQTTVREFQHGGRHYRTRIVPECSPNGSVESVMSISEDVTELMHAERELRNLTARLFRLQDEERRRIARELHDGTAQNIFAITLNLRRLAKETTNRTPAITDVISDSQQLAEQSLTEVRTLSYLLHPPILDEAGLVRALHWFVRGFSQRSGIPVDTAAIQDIGRLPLDIETALFRIVQESLSNVRRHSGSSKASVRLERHGTEVTLEISDCGHGMLEAPGYVPPGENGQMGVGITGMRQRLTQLGGRLEIESTDRGTTITVFVPVIQEHALSHAGL